MTPSVCLFVCLFTDYYQNISKSNEGIKLTLSAAIIILVITIIIHTQTRMCLLYGHGGHVFVFFSQTLTYSLEYR